MKDRERMRLRRRVLGALPETVLHAVADDAGIDKARSYMRSTLETALLDMWERNQPAAIADVIRDKIVDYLRRHL